MTTKTALKSELLREVERPQAVTPAGARLPLVLASSVAIHAVFAVILGALPTPEVSAPAFETFEVSFALPPEPAPAPAPVAAAPEPPPPAVTAAAPVAPRVRPVQPAETPTPAEPTPEPPSPPALGLPSAEDLFADPPPASEVMAGGSAPSIGTSGSGQVGGAFGGHGTQLVSTVSRGSEGGGADAEADRRRARRTYVRSLEGWLRAHARYPRSARGAEGRVELGLRLNAAGELIQARVIESSGNSSLDQAALDAAHEAGRAPAPPTVCALTERDEMRVGVVYVVR